MQNMVLATPVLSDAAIITTSVSPAGLPGSNLQHYSIKQVWRSLDAQNAYIEVQLPKAAAINLVALLGHNGTSRAFGRIRAATTQAGLTTTPAYDSGLVPLRSHQSGYDAGWASGVDDEEYGALEVNHLIHFMAVPQEYIFWRIDISDPNSTYFDAGRLYISAAWQPETNMNYGMQEGIIDPSRVSITAAGRPSPKENPKRRYADFVLGFGNEQEMRGSAFDIEWGRGVTRDVLFVPDPDDSDFLQKRVIYGRLTALQPLVNSTFQIFEKPFRIEEITA